MWGRWVRMLSSVLVNTEVARSLVRVQGPSTVRRRRVSRVGSLLVVLSSAGAHIPHGVTGKLCGVETFPPQFLLFVNCHAAWPVY